jgi:hypothetical protein
MIIQQQSQFQPIVITIETLVELEALRIALGYLSYNKVAGNSAPPRPHHDVIVGVYDQLKDLCCKQS